MTREEKIIELERMLSKVPDIMSPLRASKCSPFGKNRIYELIKSKELRAFVFQGSYIIAKTDLIETIYEHSLESLKIHRKASVKYPMLFAFKKMFSIPTKSLPKPLVFSSKICYNSTTTK